MCFKNHTSNLGRSASLYEIKSGRPSTLPSRCFTIKVSIHGSAESFKYYHFVNAGNEDEFNAYISKCKELAFYDTGVSATYGDKLITLSTCEYSHKNGRMVVVAKKIAE